MATFGVQNGPVLEICDSTGQISKIMKLDPNGQLIINGDVIQTSSNQNKIISPAELSASQNDYDPTDFSTIQNGFMKQSSSGAVDITGFAAQSAGFIFHFRNDGNFAITFKNDDAASVASNRFNFLSDIVLNGGESISLWYDDIISRWQTL